MAGFSSPLHVDLLQERHLERNRVVKTLDQFKAPPPIKCIHCLIEEAEEMVLEMGMVHVRYFCSTHCALLWAMAHVQGSETYWCRKHRRWSDMVGICEECSEEHDNRKVLPWFEQEPSQPSRDDA